MKRLFTSWTLLCVLIQLWAQAPSGYYTDATGSKGKSLKNGVVPDYHRPYGAKLQATVDRHAKYRPARRRKSMGHVLFYHRFHFYQ